MKIPSLVKLPKHRNFDYKPLYYDAVKEEIQNKINNNELNSKNQAKKQLFSFKKQHSKNKLFGLQFYLLAFLMIDFLLLLKFENLSNLAWIMILITEAYIVYKKAKK